MTIDYNLESGYMYFVLPSFDYHFCGHIKIHLLDIIIEIGFEKTHIN